jgi:SAM-dependent methyltransferase
MPAMDYDRVAHLYDAYVQFEFDLPFFLEEAKKAQGPVLELMCGTGRVSVPLVEAGIDLTCVDSSARMLEILRGKLRERDLTGEVIEADVCKLSLDRQFELIFIPFHSFAEIVDPAQQRRALEAVRAHLSPTGRFICTLHNPPVRLLCATGKKQKLGDFPLPDGDLLTLSSVEKYDPVTGCVDGIQFYEIRSWGGASLAGMDVDVHFRLVSYSEFQSLAEAAGLVPVRVYGHYSRVSFEPDKSPVMIWILRGRPAEGGQDG